MALVVEKSFCYKVRTEARKAKNIRFNFINLVGFLQTKSKFMPKKVKKQNVSINTGEPLEEKELDLNPIAVLAADDDEKEEDDELAIDDEEVDPFGDKWEQ